MQATSGRPCYLVTWVSWGGVMKDTLEVDPPAAVLLSDTADQVKSQASPPCDAANLKDTRCFAAA